MNHTFKWQKLAKPEWKNPDILNNVSKYWTVKIVVFHIIFHKYLHKKNIRLIDFLSNREKCYFLFVMKRNLPANDSHIGLNFLFGFDRSLKFWFFVLLMFDLKCLCVWRISWMVCVLKSVWCIARGINT